MSTGIATTFYLPKPLIEKLEALRDEAWEAELEGKGYSTRRKPGLSEFVRELIDKLPEPKRKKTDAVDAEKMPQAKVLDPEG